MDSPQYLMNSYGIFDTFHLGFKPYYKWIVLNTLKNKIDTLAGLRFKPYYKWIVLNTTLVLKDLCFC